MTSILATDGYKFSMAEAGWPLRTETFYYSHRRGGPFYLPFDVEEMVRSMLPFPISAEHGQLRRLGYEMGGAFWEAMSQQDRLVVNALPKGSWFFDREPVFTLTGPSALVSWLEPLVLQLNYRIQVATLALLHPEWVEPVLRTTWTCQEQQDIITETLDSVGVQPPKYLLPVPTQDWYWHQVIDRAKELVEIVENPTRIFEVGMRGVTCMEQHRIALDACKAAGVRATSNVLLARDLGMVAVGTMGHEHVQRYGNDRDAFQAMRDRRAGSASFLLDTFDTEQSGLPTAFRLIAQDPDRKDSVRFDSGDKEQQLRVAWAMAQTKGIRPHYIMEDGFNAEKTRKMEGIRRELGIHPEEMAYGYGGYLVSPQPIASDTPMNLTRDRVAAVYKLTQTGDRPTMKFANAPGGAKESIPGKPVLYRVVEGPNRGFGCVVQEGEGNLMPGIEPASEVPLTRQDALILSTRGGQPYLPSTKTSNLISSLRQQRNSYLNRSH